MRRFYLFSVDHNAASIDVAAVTKRAGLSSDIPLSAIDQLPPLQVLAQVAGKFPSAQQETLTRYWKNQMDHFSSVVAEQFGNFFETPVQEAGFSVLQDSWNGFPAMTVCSTLQSGSMGLLIVFTHLAIDADGRITSSGRPAYVEGMQPMTQPATTIVRDGDSGDNLTTTTFNILNYIGAGLAATGFPIVGTIFQALFSILAQWLNPGSNIVTQILTQIQTMLEQNDIKIETDFATSAVDTYIDWENLYFREDDFKLLSDPNADKTTQDYKDALSRANNFITNVHADFMGTPRLFDAVNLMTADTGVNSADLDTPTEAMFKFPAYLFFSGFVLFFGKQGWLYSRQLLGDNDQTTRDLANAVAGYSAQYTTYVQQIGASIQQQISQRLSYIQVSDNTGSAFWYLQDNYDGPHEQNSAEPYQLFGYKGNYTFNYCGNSAAQKAEAAANNALTEVASDYTNYIYTQINPGGQTDLLQKIQAFADNNVKFQNLETGS